MIFAVMLHRIGVREVLAAIGPLGPLALWVLVPQGLWTVLHADAWRRVLHRLGHRLPLRVLTAVHLGSEATRLSLPGGAAVAEAVAGFALRRRDVPLADVVASLATKRLLVVTTHALYGAVALAAAWEPLGRASSELLGQGRLRGLMMATTLLLVLAAGAIATTMRIGAVRRVRRVASLLPSVALRGWLAARVEAARVLDRRLAAVVTGNPGHLLAPTALLFAQWLVEALETWLLLQLLGAPIGIAEVMAMEMAASTVRSLAVFVPAGLGVQDVGYVVVLGAFGVPAPVAASFALLKRAKELVWIAVGWTALATVRSRLTTGPSAAAP